ncbi:hypothetical protein SAMN05446037_10424 [Anaerovirgula multivorans]|uniref:Uncharacterized protein n=1 Tax=Anaerovirgula multivorans TaxID=312168 RepID=A0A239K217_9FIRM|nr:hypothetical protein SAMN05446037_10424 [Anaerovirgula multivorans]
MTKKKSRRAGLLFFYLLTASTSIAIAVIKVDMASISFIMYFCRGFNGPHLLSSEDKIIIHYSIYKNNKKINHNVGISMK